MLFSLYVIYDSQTLGVDEVNNTTAAIASNLAKGINMRQAVKTACRYVGAGIRTATDMGHGNGPINHFHSTYTLPFAPFVSSDPVCCCVLLINRSGHFVEYLLDRSDVAKAWKKHTEHDFLARLAEGSLPVEHFSYYLIQDYLFLVLPIL